MLPQLPPRENTNEYFAAFLEGQEKGFDLFFREHFSLLCLFARKFTTEPEIAEDIVEDCFLRLWQKRKEFENIKSLRSYLYRMVRNACVDHLRKEQTGNKAVAELGYLSKRESETWYFQNLVRSELLREIHAALDTLPPGCNRVLTMLYLEGKTDHAIAKELNISVHTVRSQRARGLALLREKISLPAFLFFFQLLH